MKYFLIGFVSVFTILTVTENICSRNGDKKKC